MGYGWPFAPEGAWRRCVPTHANRSSGTTTTVYSTSGRPSRAGPIVLAFADAVVGFGDQGTVSVAKSMCTQAL
jgi:hypothetical protein